MLAEFLSGILDFRLPALLYFLFVITVVVFAHELGHYLAARGCGIIAEEFAVGFGPRIAFFRDRNGTEWSFRCLPLGGFVRLPDGILFQESATERRPAEVREEARDRLAPLRHRALIAAGGPIASVAFGILVFAASITVSGIATERAVIGELKDLPGVTYELEKGDRILSVDGSEVESFASLFAIVTERNSLEPTTYLVERGGDRLALPGPPLRPPVIDTVFPRSAASEAGVKAGDVIVSIDGEPVHTFSDVALGVARSDGREMRFEIWRQGNVFDTYMTGRTTEFGPPGDMERRRMIGISGGLFFTPERYTPGPIEALAIGAVQAWRITSGSVVGLYEIIASRISSCNLLGPIGIAKVSQEVASQGILDFINLIGVLSVAIGVLQLLPIPVFDGGHLMFMAYEAVSGRPFRSDVLRWAFGVGLILILALFGFALVNDFICL